MRISDMIKESFIDYPEKISTVLFASGCNYKCPACHAKHIIYGDSKHSEEEIFKYLDSRKGWIDGVVICGGEPTLQPDLINLLRELRSRRPEIYIKLDTNGSNPALIDELLKEKLVDYIAMDIKGPPSLYKKIIGLQGDTFNLRENVEKGMGIVQKAPDYEFRTTLAPIKREKGVSWMTKQEAEEMAEWAYKHAWSDKTKWYIQKFVARSKEEMLDEIMSKDNLPENMHETPHEIMEIIRNEVRKYFPKANIREEQ